MWRTSHVPVMSPVDRIAKLDQTTAQAVRLLGEQITENSKQITALKDQVHNLELRLTEFGNAQLRQDVKDHEDRLRVLQDWKATMMGKQSVVSAGIAAAVSGIVLIVSKWVHP